MFLGETGAGKSIIIDAFCDEEHYESYILLLQEQEEQKRLKKELAAQERAKKAEQEKARIAKWKADKDKAYYLICDIIGRKEIINTSLWDEWAIWNKIATNELIGRYLEENKDYLVGAISRLEDKEFNRIRYLSTVLKNSLGDYKPKAIVKEAEKPKVQVDTTFYEPVETQNNKRRSLADLEDDF